MQAAVQGASCKKETFYANQVRVELWLCKSL